MSGHFLSPCLRPCKGRREEEEEEGGGRGKGGHVSRDRGQEREDLGNEGLLKGGTR